MGLWANNVRFVGRWVVGSLGHWENYHRTIIQDQIQIQIQDQVHIRVNIKPESKTAKSWTKKTPPIRAGLKLTLLGYKNS